MISDKKPNFVIKKNRSEIHKSVYNLLIKACRNGRKEQIVK